MTTRLLRRLLFACALATTLACGGSGGSGVAFYVTNAGDEGVWDHIVVEIGDSSDTFFTPEHQNMGAGSVNCDDPFADSFAAFRIPPGTYAYTASGGRGAWSGTVTIEPDTCTVVPLAY